MNIQTGFFRTALIFAVFTVSALNVSVAAVPEPAKRVVDLTFLKSNPGHRQQLRTFIVANWFAMDKVARDQGLIASFTILDSGTDEGPWNLVVSTTYLDERGYYGVADAFEKIRVAHKTVLVDGKKLGELGVIVDSKSLFEIPGMVTH